MSEEELQQPKKRKPERKRKLRVALSTTWQEIAGEYEYARNLIEYVQQVDPDIEVTPFHAPFLVDNLLQQVADYDVVHFNFCFGPHSNLTTPGTISRFNSRRVVLTFHENNPQDNRGTYPFLNEAARVVVHEKNPHGFIPIPHGIPVLEPTPWTPENRTIGTAGFPFPDKRVPMIAEAAAYLAQRTDRVDGVTMLCCASGHANTYAVREQVLRIFPTAKYVTDFLQQPELLNLLATNLVNVFIPNSRRLGPSGSVRLGLATQSHIVLCHSAMFRDLEDYADEIEFVDGPWNEVSPQRVAEACLRVLQNGKRPKRILEDGSWTKAAKLYAEVYRSI